MTVVGAANDHVELKEVKYAAQLKGISVHTEAIPDADILEEGDAFNFKYSVNIPAISPSGEYDLKFNVNDMDGKSVACFAIKVTL